MTYCLDAWPVVAWLRDETPASERVDELLPSRPVMSWVNLAEVYYVAARLLGHDRAGAIVDDLRHRTQPIDVTRPIALRAAAIKADHSLGIADAFAVATAIEHEAVLLTGDPEILDAGAGWQVEDLR